MQPAFTRHTSRFVVQEIHFQNVKMRLYHFKLNFLSSGMKKPEFNGATQPECSWNPNSRKNRRVVKHKKRKKCIRVWCVYKCNLKFCSKWLHSAQRGNSAPHGNIKEEECWMTASLVRGPCHDVLRSLCSHQERCTSRGWNAATRSGVSAAPVCAAEYPHRMCLK